MTPNPKPLASLSSALLARKPGDRRGPRRMALSLPAADMAMANELADDPVMPAKVKRIAFTLRLEPARHARLKQASAATGRSAQHLLTEALDAFLETVPGEDAVDAPSDDGRHVNRWGLIR